MDQEKRQVGRPRIFSSPEEFDARVDNYIKLCRATDGTDNPEPITLTGMVLALGFSCKDSFYQYEKYPEFSESVKRARTFIEQAYEKRMIKDGNLAGSIFALKNLGWKDRQDVYINETEVTETLTWGDDQEAD